MSVPKHIEQVEAALRSTESLYDAGISPIQLRGLVAQGALVRVARGWFVAADDWNDWFAEDRHLAAVVAAHRTATAPPLFSHYSAAVLLRLPLWRIVPDRVHTSGTYNSSASSSVQRHRLEVPETQQGEVAGYRCTSPDRTIADLASIATTEVVLGSADRVLRRLACSNREVDRESWIEWRSKMEALCASLPVRTKGKERLRRVIAIADPRAESVLESVSRLQLLRLGYAVELQVAVPSPSGSSYFMDFELLGCNAFGECDGAVKYKDPQMLAGQTPAERAIAEKRRDNWTMGATGRLMAHWGAREAATPESLGRLLQSYHVPLPRHR